MKSRILASNNTLKNWNLIFTSSGKYFFYNDQSGERCWIPPVEVIEFIKKSSRNMEFFFDPFHIEDEEFNESDNEDSENSEDNKDSKDNEDNGESRDIEAQSHDHAQSRADSQLLEDQFKLYLLKNSVDPFAPWPSILSSHGSSPEFLAIPSDRRRQDLFKQVCPLLIDQKRENSRRKLEEAKEWWRQVKEENWRVNASWFQVTKKVKGNQKFALLNEKECEKEYKNKK